LDEHAHGHHHHDPDVQHHFESFEQQQEASKLGMWLFLAQEVMFFGGLFASYTIFRFLYPEAWSVGSHQTSIPIGAFNTSVLLLSSFSMALAVYSCQVGNTKNLVRFLILTLLLGMVFVGVKLQWEYLPKWEHGLVPGDFTFNPDPSHLHGNAGEWLAADPANVAHLQMFFVMYFLMTGMHALHMLIGFGILLVLIFRAWRGVYGPRRFNTIENFGLYWHFVDIVWVFLFPLFYLVH
jgi:cytochrome c oxidase subunit 3